MVTQKTQNSKTIIVLSNGDWLRVPPGHDPDQYRRQAESAPAPLSSFCTACQFGNHCGNCTCCK